MIIDKSGLLRTVMYAVRDKRVLRERMRRKKRQMMIRHYTKIGLCVIGMILAVVFMVRGIIIPIAHHVAGGGNSDQTVQAQADTEEVQANSDAAVRQPLKGKSDTDKVAAMTAGWHEDANGKWYQNTDGTYFSNGFQDIDGDGAKDVIVIINYVTGAGPQGMMPRKTIRIFSSQDNGFVIQHDLMDELMENMNEDDISIPAICDYVTLMETNEIYDGYRTIYQQYFADEGCDFMISYGANGNSRVILNENEEIIEYLVYDRLSENEKCELYVLYRSKKNTDGSWYISEAEILDIFAYSMSTKDVVSSGKTSWSATGSEEHEIN